MRHFNFAVENPGKHCLSHVMKIKLTTMISHIESMYHQHTQIRRDENGSSSLWSPSPKVHNPSLTMRKNIRQAQIKRQNI